MLPASYALRRPGLSNREQRTRGGPPVWGSGGGQNSHRK
jgi:hypothetical protein